MKRRLAACLLHSIDAAVVSECLCYLKAEYLVQSPDICSGYKILYFDHPVSVMG